MGVQINDFLQAFSGDSKFCLNLPVFWGVTITGVSEGSINAVLSYAGEKWQAKTSPIEMSAGFNILVAQGVTLPNESSNFISMSVGGGSGGFLPAYGLDYRSDFLSRSFNINFLETTLDLEHNYFRPWMIAVGIKGLIEQGENLKSTIEVRQYKNDGSFMKGFRFKKAYPTNVEGFELNYNDTDFKIKSVAFACENYEQL